MTDPDRARIRRSFRRGLASYHGSAAAQARIASGLVDLLAEAGAPARFETGFEFGCGTGHLTRALVDRFPIRCLGLNDLVPEAAQDLAQSLQGSDISPAQIAVLPGPVEQLVLPTAQEIIFSGSTIQWLPDVRGALARLSDALAPKGWLALSGFGHGQFAELRALGFDAAAPSYADASEWQDLLPPELDLIAARQNKWPLCFDTARDLLRHLRETGVNARARHHWTRRDLQRFETDYKIQFGQAERLPLTYDPVWVIARKR